MASRPPALQGHHGPHPHSLFRRHAPHVSWLCQSGSCLLQGFSWKAFNEETKDRQGGWHDPTERDRHLVTSNSGKLLPGVSLRRHGRNSVPSTPQEQECPGHRAGQRCVKMHQEWDTGTPTTLSLLTFPFPPGILSEHRPQPNPSKPYPSSHTLFTASPGFFFCLYENKHVTYGAKINAEVFKSWKLVWIKSKCRLHWFYCILLH